MSKRRCTQCKKYFTADPEMKSTTVYCSSLCIKDAVRQAKEKAFEKAVARSKEKVIVPKTKRKKKEKSPYKKAKDDTWDAFSIYIRTRDCIRFTGTPDQGMCITCRRPYPFKKLQAGHFIQGRGNAVLFDERIVYSQCLGCNGNPPYGKGGNYVEYFIFMEEEWGRKKIDEFRALKDQTVKYKVPDLLELKDLFEAKTKELLDAV